MHFKGLYIREQLCLRARGGLTPGSYVFLLGPHESRPAGAISPSARLRRDTQARRNRPASHDADDQLGCLARAAERPRIRAATWTAGK